MAIDAFMGVCIEIKILQHRETRLLLLYLFIYVKIVSGLTRIYRENASHLHSCTPHQLLTFSLLLITEHFEMFIFSQVPSKCAKINKKRKRTKKLCSFPPESLSTTVEAAFS